MNALTKIALQKPLTFVVMAILIAIFGTLATLRMPVDIFPSIRIPVIAVSWTYTGLSPEDVSNRIITPYQRALTTTVADIEHIESQSMTGMGIVRIFFQPGVDIRTATAQVTAVSQTMLRQLPPGTTPPFIVNYDASTVPVLQLALSGEGLSEQQLNDLGASQIRTQLLTLPGVAMPLPSGGKQRQIQIDLNPVALQSYGLSAADVSAAIAAQNQISPAGFIKIGSQQYNVKLNNAPDSIQGLGDIPVKVVNGATIYMRDVASVRDGSSPQQNIVHVEGSRSVLLTILKNGAASTLSVVEGVKDMVPQILEGLTESIEVLPVADQSVFVRASMMTVVNEALLVAALISLLILLFLGSWRATLIVAASIPLSIFAAIAVLNMFGQSLNAMTLGGLAIAIGILVDEATVTIENIERHLGEGKGVTQAIMDGASEILVPVFVALLCICIVFVPMFFLPGISGFLFVPMALSVIFAMVASFLLSRTLVLTMAMYLLKPHGAAEHHHEPSSAARSHGILAPFIHFQKKFEAGFERLRDAYTASLRGVLATRRLFAIGFMGLVLVSFLLVPFLGRNFFPAVDSSSILMHVRMPAGIKIEESAARFEMIGRSVRELIPAEQLDSIINNIGMPVSMLNMIYNTSGTISPQDGDIMISLKPGNRSAEHIARLRQELPRLFPGTSFSFLPADITSQILNFGSPAPLDVQVTGRNLTNNRAFAEQLLHRIQTIPGVADARIQQPASAPQLNIDIDRSRIGQYGLTARDVTNSLGASLAGTQQTAPVFFVNPANGVSYPVVAQVPEYFMSNISDLENVPVSSATNNNGSQSLGGLASITRSTTLPVVSQYNIQPMINIFATTQGRDLGAVAADINAIIAELETERPAGTSVTLRGQYQTMNIAFGGLGYGLLGAIVLIYLLIVVNFQSWKDPLVIISALPAALAGIVWILFVSFTPLSVPALTGAIMCMGVATANSILLVSFARDRLAETGDAIQAAVEAGYVRLRPVLMTALAMIVGMIPMALGIGEGAEQNAPLGRAVIGGLIAATIATLFFVPTLFSLAHRHVKADQHPSQPSSELMPTHV
ncbi:efflux RND transporter permease subunit [Cellvibrio polysaccharolyticus]|uniref:AcrB/AcrD/AcrF family protein n=1 Tax=Cellvibrio polysaccharolyticus TaxID=2082724 RepID=A0A928V355_9GAMM|nr:efflux RND transporter permease subunit [Cellvibrio polysaccharolyticus]MBE8715779.1 AcrB/AcrD/AcrF family protein [Cellvibrio polysaccharolyticus]